MCYPSNGRQVNIRRLRERPVVSPGISNHQKSQLPEAAWIWAVMSTGTKRPAIAVAPVAAAHFSTAHWPVSPDDTLTGARFSMATKA